MSEGDQEKIRIKPFDPDIYDRAAFSCGVERIDNFIKRTANKQQKGEFIRVWVAVGDDETSILGFYAINAHSINMPRVRRGMEVSQQLTFRCLGYLRPDRDVVLEESF